MLEYVGLTLVAVAVLTGIFVGAGGYRLLPTDLEAAVCRVVGGKCAPAKAPPPGTPDINSCTVRG
ncbi:MAG: hypothetical protein GEV11_01745 [Streptosporangiales bacterium]|nr:hypothetical protein [Streptosporangiales bacterium]